jgi:hypothetical protein
MTLRHFAERHFAGCQSLSFNQLNNLKSSLLTETILLKFTDIMFQSKDVTITALDKWHLIN